MTSGDHIFTSDFPFNVDGVSPQVAGGFPQYPAWRHQRGAVLTFADGHVEHFRWRDSRLYVPIKRNPFATQPIRGGPDVAWLWERTAPRPEQWP